MPRPDDFKARLLRDEFLCGVTLMFPSPELVEAIARLGFDWVLLDCEHGALGPNDVEHLVRAADACGVVALVRPATNAPHAIASALDRGAHGVQVPHVSSVDDARRAVAAGRFPPHGTRGLAAGTRASGYGIGFDARRFVADSDRDVVIAVQIEDAAALRHVEAIVAVPGVDVGFVGPTDLALSLGHPGDLDAPPVRAAVEGALRRIRTAGRIAGIAGNGAALRRYRELGVRYAYTHLHTLLSEGRDRFRAQLDA